MLDKTQPLEKDKTTIFLMNGRNKNKVNGADFDTMFDSLSREETVKPKTTFNTGRQHYRVWNREISRYDGSNVITVVRCQPC